MTAWNITLREICLDAQGNKFEWFREHLNLSQNRGRVWNVIEIEAVILES